MKSALPETVFGFDVGFDVPVELVFALMVLFVFVAANVLHLSVVVEVQLVVRRLLLSQVDVEVLGD